MKYKVFSETVKNIPWQPDASEKKHVVWRYRENPVIGRNPCDGLARVFNSGVAPYRGGYAGIFRGEDETCMPHLYFGESGDGLHWKIDVKPLSVEKTENSSMDYGYDPRLVKIGNTYYIIWCTDLGGAPTIAIATTKDFKTYLRLPNGFLPCNRNGVLFDEKINEKFFMLSRPSDTAHTPFGDIYISESPDLVYWGNHKLLMKNRVGEDNWSALKIGAGPAPIKTEAGWLLLYHGVHRNCNSYVYSMGAALLDLNDPAKVIARSKKYLLTPEEWYEERGFVPNVVFPCSALVDGDGKVAIYYGAADSYICLAFSTVDLLIDFVKENNILK